MSDIDHVSLDGDELRRLLHVGRALVAEVDVDAVLERVLEAARDLTGARYAALGVLSGDGLSLERFITAGIDAAEAERIGALPQGRGVLGVLITHPEPLTLDDVGSHPQSYGFPAGHPPMTTFLGVPIRIRDRVFGNLYLTEKAGGEPFDDHDQELILVLADWAALAVDNARTHEAALTRQAVLERTMGSLRATNDIARAIGGETELERVLELVVKRARALLEVQTVVVTLVDDARTGLCIEAMAGEGPRDILGDTIPLDGTLSGLVVGSGRAQRLTPGDNRLRHVLADRLDPRAGLVVPLLHRGAVLGTLAAFERDGDRVFSEEEEELLTGFAASAAISVGTARRVSEQQRRRAVEASERERARWARELHDETLQELAGLRVLLAKAAGDPAAVETALEQIELSITGLRQLITELRPAALDQYGVAAALEALIERERAATGIDIRAEIALAYEAGLADRRHTPELEITIYRIVQEAVHNAVKHAAADVITASVQEGESDVVVEVHDDGRGFDTDQASDGFGLVGIRERVELAGGELQVASSPGHGATLRARLPTRRR